MVLNVTKWSREAADLYLAWESRPIPLVQGRGPSEEVAGLARQPAQALFPEAASPDALLTGLLLLGGGWEDAHEAAQNLDTREGSYFHAIVHRMEPEAWNAAYWFRRVGKHPIFTELSAQAEHIVANRGLANFTAGSIWDPGAFIDFCEQALLQPESDMERAAIEIQRAEWELLMEWCNQPRSSSLRLMRS
jgi:hypothetical protein